MVSVARFAQINMDVLSKNGGVSTGAVSITLTSTDAVGQVGGIEFQIPSGVPGVLFTSVPAGLKYNVSVKNLPVGYKVESLSSGGIDLLANPLVVGNANTQTIRVVIAPKD